MYADQHRTQRHTPAGHIVQKTPMIREMCLAHSPATPPARRRSPSHPACTAPPYLGKHTSLIEKLATHSPREIAPSSANHLVPGREKYAAHAATNPDCGAAYDSVRTVHDASGVDDAPNVVAYEGTRRSRSRIPRTTVAGDTAAAMRTPAPRASAELRAHIALEILGVREHHPPRHVCSIFLRTVQTAGKPVSAVK